MPDDEKVLNNEQPSGDNAPNGFARGINNLLIIFLCAAGLLFVVQNFMVFINILKVVVGFGAVVLIHEFGHFAVAKLSDIKVEAFSIGFSPVLAGIKKTEQGFRFRLFPDFIKDSSGEAGWCFTAGRGGTGGETEYRIGLIPFGGFVKMLGQDDVGAVKKSDDPRSFMNKPVLVRVAVIAAGVIFNAVSAVFIFMAVFMHGIDLPPAVVGDVVPGRPAAEAGLLPGDEVIEINGKTHQLDFSDIMVAAALADANEKVDFRVKRPDGSIHDFSIAPQYVSSTGKKVFGIISPSSLTVAELTPQDAEQLHSRTGLKPGDRIISIADTPVENYRQYRDVLDQAPSRYISLKAERQKGDSGGVVIQTEVEIQAGASYSDLDTGFYSLIPRLRIVGVTGGTKSLKDVFGSSSKKQLKPGDIILAADGVKAPTHAQLTDIVNEHEDKKLDLEILRTEGEAGSRKLNLTVMPRYSKEQEKVMIGIALSADMQHPVLAGSGAESDIQIPRGAKIVSVEGEEVSTFRDIVNSIYWSTSKVVTLNWSHPEKGRGTAGIDKRKAGSGEKIEHLLEIPFKQLERTYAASSPVKAVVMGARKTFKFVVQTYATLKSLLAGVVSTSELTGPVGIVTMSYKIVAERPVVEYVYFMGLISVAIAVFNFLPLPPLDGGLVVVLIAEKIKGAPLSIKAQTAIAYIGWIFIGTLLIYVTFNDIVKFFFS